ncbi:DUF3299 domain-containing protein [Bdellovibrio reynosensis]|uniref:DUF3299 domain-containing protein n=1 Tax=Bdellovibrio reynosensis TaxID=2835041 RepID=A0ABY4CFU1_9BACT|nr:DUF3299 domain-containing protein [Bdellovibrio reynosensis]UOF02747.1 DUF3299 domain-containing protein [Bdellovibrio reynosensis]
MKKWVLAGIFILAVVTGAVIYHGIGGGSANLNGVEVDWRLLGEMDYISGTGSSELTSLNGKAVKIPGFMVPLEDDQKDVIEFLLVPSPQACIHVPAPPPNQMVYVKMKRGTEVAVGPIWVYGTLNLVTKKSMYGDASFELVGEAVEPYK